MISFLSIKNMAVIEAAELQFASGLHVFTGETGAGKSIVMDALSLILGGRGSADWIRHGSDKAELEAQFDLSADHPAWHILAEKGIEADHSDGVMIRREIFRGGKNVCRVNGQLSNLAFLKELGETLVDLHGQHEHQSLSKPETHIEWLDTYGGTDLLDTKDQYKRTYKEVMQLRKKLNELQQNEQWIAQRCDILNFQLQEIVSIKPKANEEEQLELERNQLQHAEKRVLNANAAHEALNGQKSVLPQLHKAIKSLSDLLSIDASVLQPVVDQLQSAYYQIEDASYTIRDFADGIEADPKRLDALDSRLDDLKRLKRKYGATIEEVLKQAEIMRSELNELQSSETKVAELEKELDQKNNVLRTLGGKLRGFRQHAALQLADKVEHELKELQMPKARFLVSVKATDSDQCLPNGMDHVEWLFSSNPGEPPRAMSKIASGGELSRIMLALKSIFAALSPIVLLVFDEVDTGVSGRAAQAIAEKMAHCSRSAQVFAVSHLAQVACMADTQWLVEKQVQDERTFTVVKPLENEIRVEELARMLSGAQIKDSSKAHATEMLEEAFQFKRNLPGIKLH